MAESPSNNNRRQRRHETSTVDRSISSLRIFGRITVDRARFFRVFRFLPGS